MQSKLFRDFDEFSSSVRDVDCVMTLQNPENRCWHFDEVDLPQIHIQQGRLGSGNIVEGEGSSHGYLFYLPRTDTCAYSANGVVISQNAMMVLEPGCEFCLSTKNEHDWCSIFVPTDKLARDEQNEGLPDSNKMTCRTTHANLRIARSFQALVGQVITLAASCPTFESSPAAIRAGEEALRLARSIIGPKRIVEPIREGRPSIRRDEIIRRAMEVIDTRTGGFVKVSELAVAASVSEHASHSLQ